MGAWVAVWAGESGSRWRVARSSACRTDSRWPRVTRSARSAGNGTALASPSGEGMASPRRGPPGTAMPCWPGRRCREPASCRTPRRRPTRLRQAGGDAPMPRASPAESSPNRGSADRYLQAPPDEPTGPVGARSASTHVRLRTHASGGSGDATQGCPVQPGAALGGCRSGRSRPGGPGVRTWLAARVSAGLVGRHQLGRRAAPQSTEAVHRLVGHVRTGRSVAVHRSSRRPLTQVAPLVHLES